VNQHKHLSDLDQGRAWLDRAARALIAWTDSVAEDSAARLLGSPEYARAAAVLGAGFVALAHTERAARTSATLDAAAERVRRAADEARPHDDEPINLRETDADMAARFAGQIGELTSRIEDALSWFHEPDDATPEIQLAKIRAALTGESRRG